MEILNVNEATSCNFLTQSLKRKAKSHSVKFKALNFKLWFSALNFTLFAILVSLCFLNCPAAQAAEQIIIDHTSVDLYDKIPAYYMNQAKKMWINIPGESHSSGYRKGISFLMQQNPAYNAVVTEEGSLPEPYREDALRISQAVRNIYSKWTYGTGESVWYANPADTQIKLHLDYSNTNNLKIDAIGFGWCWDMTWQPSGWINIKNEEDPVYHVHWNGSSVGGPQGNTRWGLDADDYALTGNTVCMDTYLNATQAYADYVKAKGYKTKVLFTTGPADGSAGSENGFQRHLKHEHIRNFVKRDPDRILFDYADILCYNNAGQQYTAVWTRGSEFGALSGTKETVPSIHPDNAKDFNGSYVEDGDHIGQVGALRLGKALWVLAARLAGWEPVQTTKQISQFGITWTFDKEYEYGKFVNGDYWVVGPVTVSSVKVRTDIETPVILDGKKIHGSVVNPQSQYQGYDERGPLYDASLTETFPLSLFPGDSLVSSESWDRTIDEADVCGVIQDLGRPYLRNAAVLTVLASAPPSDAFRPAYFGTDKTIYRKSDLDISKLPKILPPQYVANPRYDFDDVGPRPYRDSTNYPTIADQYAVLVERPWISHINYYDGELYHPTHNQPQYYRETYRIMQQITLLLCCDLDTIYSAGTKEKIIIPMVQMGIDNFYIFTVVAGDRSNQIFPILLAGHLFNNASFLNVTQTMVGTTKTMREIYYRSQAESTITSQLVSPNTFYNGTTVGYRGNPGTVEEYEHLYPGSSYNYATGDHDGSDFGEWIKVPYVVEQGYPCPADKLEDYRRIISPNIVGLALAVDIMGLRNAWNHPAFFDYVVRWTEFEGRSSGVTFVDKMWAQYKFSTSDVIFGDISGEGDITAYDAALAARIAVGLDELGDKLQKADVSGDGQVTAYDAALIAQKAVGLITKFPVES
jgi:hypothetical protein